MAGAVIGALRVTLGMDSANFERGSKRAQKNLANMGRQFAKVTGLATAMGVGVAAAALKGAGQIDEVAKSARRLDASIGGFRALELSASEAGVSLSGLTNDIQTMNRELSSIGVSGNGQRALDALGLSIKDLEGLDADAKLAAIADKVKALGFSSGQTTAILRDLGVRNREMALLVLQGGDAIRAARDDVRSYGLEISNIDASRIELANDRIGRLGLITQYAGQQLALSLVPALGRMAQAMTNSLREGEFLRTMIDGLVANLGTITGTVLVAVGVIGIKYVAALAAAKIANFSFAASLGVVKKALVRTGIGALIVGAGYLVGSFTDLVGAAGGFGGAMSLLGAVGTEAWERIKLGMAGLTFQMQSGWMRSRADAMDAFSGILQIALSTVNKIIGAHVGAYQAVAAAWSALPDAFKRIGALAINGLIEMIGRGIGGVLQPLNAILSKFGSAPIPAPDFSEWKVEVGEAVSAVGKAGDAFSEAFGRDYINAAGVAESVRDLSAEYRSAGDLAASLGQAFKDGATAPMTSLAALQDVVASAGSASSNASGEAEALAASLDDVGGAGGAAAGSLGKVGGAGGSAASGMAKASGSATKLAKDLSGPLKTAVGGASDAFGDFVVRGFKGFKTFREGVVDSFKKMLSQMVSMAAKNRIMLAFGSGAAPSGAAAATKAASGSGGVGILGAGSKLLGAFGSGTGVAGLAGGTGLLGGAGNVIGGFASGGFSGALGGLTSSVAGATTGLAGLGTAVGAIAVPLLAVGAIFSFFKKKVKVLDTGLRVSVRGVGTTVDTFKKIQTKRFWGLSKKVSTEYSRASATVANPVRDAISKIQTSVRSAASELGIGASAFARFSYQIKVTTKGLSDDAAQAAIQEEFEKLGNAYAGMVPGLAGARRAGEAYTGTLTRLVQHLDAVNSSFDVLGLTLFNVGVSGAASASKMVEAFGTLDQFTQLTGQYYQQFYTVQERASNATKALMSSLSELGINVLPKTRLGFRALIDEADKVGNSDLVASLIQLSPAFAEVNEAAKTLTESMNSGMLFRTRQDQIFAQSGIGNGVDLSSIDKSDAKTRGVLAEILRAIREGDLNNARISTGILRETQRAAIEGAVT